MSGLVSRWADDPELVDKAKKQDSSKGEDKPLGSKPTSPVTSQKGKPLESKWASPVTSEKGKPLASRWADAPDEQEEKESLIKKDHKIHPKRSSPKKNHKKNEERIDLSEKFEKTLQLEEGEEDDDRVEMSPDAKKLAARLGISNGGATSKPKIQFKKAPTKPQPQHDEDEWEDEEEEATDEEDEEEEEVQHAKPTKAANDFASRLGISIEDKPQIRNKREQERSRYRDERVNARLEWDHGKNNHQNHHQNRHQDRYQSHRQNHNSQKESHPRPKRESSRKNTTKAPEPEPVPEIDEETRLKQLEQARKLDEFLQNSNNKDIDWADFDDIF